MAPKIRVEGHDDLRRAVRAAKSKAGKDALRDAHRAIAKPVAEKGARLAPKKSGRLAKTVKGLGSQRDATIKAGTKARTPYAEVIHFGWPRRNIAPNEFLFKAVEESGPEITKAFEGLAEDVRKAITDG